VRALTLAAFALHAWVVLGCSDDGGATGGGANSARGGLYLTVSHTAASTCPSQGHSKSIGVVPPTFTSTGETIGDGEAGATVSCKVSGSSTFSLTAKIAQAGIELAMTGEVPAHGIGSAKLEYTDELLAGLHSSPDSMPCTIQTHEEPMQASPGSVHARLACAIVSTPSSECVLSGPFVFEGCEL
jgi:hypothetical protein